MDCVPESRGRFWLAGEIQDEGKAEESISKLGFSEEAYEEAKKIHSDGDLVENEGNFKIISRRWRELSQSSRRKRTGAREICRYSRKHSRYSVGAWPIEWIRAWKSSFHCCSGKDSEICCPNFIVGLKIPVEQNPLNLFEIRLLNNQSIKWKLQRPSRGFMVQKESRERKTGSGRIETLLS